MLVLSCMKALFVVSDKTHASALVAAIQRRGLDIEYASPAELTAALVTRCSLVLLFPARDGSDLDACTAACRRVESIPDRVALVLAIAHDTRHLNILVDAGADDFSPWPVDEETLNRRIEICKTRIRKRERDVFRSQRLLEAVRDAELGEQRFRHLAESSTEILTRCSPGGIRLYVSPACRDILGYDPDELLGSSIFDILHLADTGALIEALEQLEKGADAARAMVRFQRHDGDFAWMEMSCRSVRDRKTNAIEEIISVARDITALVRIEHDKLQSEGQFELFASRAPVGIVKVDRTGHCEFINPRACELLGTTPMHAAGHGWMKLLDVRDLATLVESSRQRGLDEKAYSWEMAIRRDSAEKVWLAVKAIPIRDHTGRPTGYLGTLIDVTREQRARQDWLASEERFRSIVERITELVCRYLPDGTLTYVNDAYCRAFGTTPEELVGKSFFPLLPAEDKAIIDRVIASLSPANPVGISEHRVVLPNGEVRWQEWCDRGTFDDEGRLVELVGTARDITDRRTFERELAEAGHFLRDVLDAVPDPISVEGDDGNFVMVNRSFAELVEHPREEIVGRPVISIRPEAQGVNVGRWPAVSDEHEITWPRADGQLRSLFEKRAVLADRNGHRVLVSVMRDVTERKRYEAQFALTERLASLGTLAAGIAHEINNPLSYVIGNVAFAFDNLPSTLPPGDPAPQVPEIRNALCEALEGAQRIANIVRDVKVFSRADRETLKLVDPAGVVDASYRIVQGNIERRATVTREFATVPQVLGNEARLAQVMVNLLMNALQALPDRSMNENRIVIAVRSEQRSVVMEVRDNGQGISSENLRRIFDPFFTTKAVGEGMGLGLSICNSIINAHGGRIDVTSTLGIGTAFRVILPVAQTPTAPQ